MRRLRTSGRRQANSASKREARRRDATRRANRPELSPLYVPISAPSRQIPSAEKRSARTTFAFPKRTASPPQGPRTSSQQSAGDCRLPIVDSTHSTRLT